MNAASFVNRWLVALAAVVAALQIGLLFSAIQGRASILRNGAEVVLKVQPVDPRDLLRGDYVRLGYDIGQLPAGLFSAPFPSDATRGQAVYVQLAPGAEGFHEAVAASFDPASLPAGEGRVMIRGAASSLPDAGNPVMVDYGIERFYLPEGEGRAIEEDMRQRSFTMKVAVSTSGDGQIKAFYDGERLLYAEPYY